VIAIILSRALRFFILAEMMQHWGEQIRRFIDRYFGRLLMAFGAKTVLTVAFFWVLGK
jgi:threonine/homoserine/homoserine lactone efflux protein